MLQSKDSASPNLFIGRCDRCNSPSLLKMGRNIFADNPQTAEFCGHHGNSSVLFLLGSGWEVMSDSREWKPESALLQRAAEAMKDAAQPSELAADGPTAGSGRSGGN